MKTRSLFNEMERFKPTIDKIPTPIEISEWYNILRLKGYEVADKAIREWFNK